MLEKKRIYFIREEETVFEFFNGTVKFFEYNSFEYDFVEYKV